MDSRKCQTATVSQALLGISLYLVKRAGPSYTIVLLEKSPTRLYGWPYVQAFKRFLPHRTHVSFLNI